MSIEHVGDRGGRTWFIDVQVEDAGSADVLSVQTSWAGHADSPLVVAPPRLLGLWVEHLDLDDGGVAVIGEPRRVDDEQRAEAFCRHVLSDVRALPIVALSRGAYSQYYGVDPRVLAAVLSGLAHVACLSPATANKVCEGLGLARGPDDVAARILAPGFKPLSASVEGLLVRPPRPLGSASEPPGSFRRMLVERVCALSVEAAAVAGSPAS